MTSNEKKHQNKTLPKAASSGSCKLTAQCVNVPCLASYSPAEKTSGGPCVYILECSDGSLYTGWTNDFSKRLKTHNSGKGAKYTRSRLPVAPVYIEHLPDKISAVKREAAIKKLTRTKKLKLINSNENELD